MDGFGIVHKGLGVTELMTQLCYSGSNDDIETRGNEGVVLHLVFRGYVHQVFIGWRFCDYENDAFSSYLSK